MSLDNDSAATEKNRIEKNTLYLVATPIGNLSDITARALKILSEVDFIAAEDTRVSLRLLTHFGIRKPLISYFEHNKRARGELITEKIIAGNTCALITDAGTPAISDPGEDIVRLCAELGISVVPVPGACAAICALTVSGLDTGRFCFEGFIPTNKAERKKQLDALLSESRTMIFYEAPHKLKNTLSDLSKTFGTEREISICCELTKLNERVLRCTIAQALAHFCDNNPRGEYVIVLSGAKTAETNNAFWCNMTIREHVDHYINDGLTKMEAIKSTAHDRSLPKNTIYKEMI